VQRRRRKKAAPSNPFGAGSHSTQRPKSNRTPEPNPTRARPQIAPPPSVPGSKKIPKQSQTTKAPINPDNEIIEIKEEPTSLEDIPIVEEVAEDHPIEDNLETIVDDKNEVDIVQEQILGSHPRKDMGLKKEKPLVSKTIVVGDDTGKSQRARQIIQNSKIKASIAVEEAKTLKKTQLKTPTKTETPKKPQRKFRNKNSSYQPANRARRLDRSRHMEYKYEMRGLLLEIEIAEEHRSNILATIWARGERQTANGAKEFLSEKFSEGIIDDDQMSSLEKIVDRYTVRR
tara:strand:- start:114 stop:974 length:861 start_codon:yes stop_codon:yes gene_type:complete